MGAVGHLLHCVEGSGGGSGVGWAERSKMEVLRSGELRDGVFAGKVAHLHSSLSLHLKIVVYNTVDHAGLLQRLKELLHGKLFEE